MTPMTRRLLALTLSLLMLFGAMAALAETSEMPESAEDDALLLSEADPEEIILSSDAEELDSDIDLGLLESLTPDALTDDESVIVSNALGKGEATIATNDATGDFNISGDTLVKYTGAGGNIVVPSTVKKIDEWPLPKQASPLSPFPTASPASAPSPLNSART